MQIRQIVSLRDIDQLNVEDESGASGNLAGHPVGPVAHVRRDGELRPLALGHLGNALVPPGNHLLSANVELERLAAVAWAVNLSPVLESKDIVAGDLLAWLWEGGAISWLKGLNVDAHGGLRLKLRPLVESNSC